MVFFAKQADRVFLFNFPVVQREHQVLKRLEHNTEIGVGRLFGHQVLAATGLALHAVTAVEAVLVRVNVEADVIVSRVRPGDIAFVDCDEVRNAEAF